jgi:hypothetical protein
MADSKTTTLTENTAPLGSDLDYMVDDPAGTPLSQKIYKGSQNLLPDGYMVNGKISVTVASNNITVALKTKNGTDPSATDPVSVWINGTYRRCTAALSVTKNAATDWFAAGSQLPATETDFFPYLIWNTTPVTDIVDIGFGRLPSFRVFSDTNATTTNQGYCANGNASLPTSTDDMVVVGRFAATLSATAAFNWSVPSYTSKNLIQTPIYETRVLSYTPTITGYSANPTGTIYNYKLSGTFVTVYIVEGTNGTSNSGNTTYTGPIAAQTVTNGAWIGVGAANDNGAALTTPVRVNASSGSTTISFFPNFSGASTWTASAGKRIITSTITYPVI